MLRRTMGDGKDYSTKQKPRYSARSVAVITSLGNYTTSLGEYRCYYISSSSFDQLPQSSDLFVSIPPL